MRTHTIRPALAAAVTALTLTACGSGTDSAGAKREASTEASDSTAARTTYRLGESSPPQESTWEKYKGAQFTVTPTKVETGTKADLDNSGLKQDTSDGPQVPVYVWITLSHKSGKPMEAGAMDDDLVVRTDKGERTKALVVLLGEAKWPNCPAAPEEKTLSAGQAETICQAFLIPAGQKATAVELSQGYYDDPLVWSANS